MNELPIIRLTVEGMKTSILMALTEQQTMFDEAARAAVEHFCQPENVNNVVAHHVTKAINDAVSDEVMAYFRHSAPGRVAIREAVKERLDLIYPLPAAPSGHAQEDSE